ncbi:translation initiation inhibitor [Amylocystis lapponica]|nr:translation initiation inhibitor [Amylocystis lapponica]
MSHPSLGLISTPNAPPAGGPYTQAIRVGKLLFVSGSLGIDPVSNKFVSGGVAEQAEQALKNLKAVVEAGGSTVGQVVKTTVFLADMNDFATINEVYARFFAGHKPARSCVQVARLPLDGRFEIEAIAR